MSLFYETAESLGAKLCRDAFWWGPRCTWIGASTLGAAGRQTTRNAFGPDLYSGTSGIGILIAELASMNNERIFRKTAEGAAAQAISQLEEMPGADRIGFYTGHAGIAYGLVRIGHRLGNSQLVEKGIAVMEGVNKLDLNEQRLDVMGGVAGAIPVLLLFHRLFGKQQFLDLAIRCADKLDASARRTDAGCSWKTPSQERDLTGFSHGAGGIAWVLLELGASIGENRFRSLAAEGFRYERSCFNREEGNWPDLRSNMPQSDNSPHYSVAWCHGAPGICLTRLRALELTPDDTFAEEATIAAMSTGNYLKTPRIIETGFSLCHGCAGNAEILLESAEAFNNDDHRKLAEQIAVQAAEWFENGRAPWPCGVTGAMETPSLLLGTAGIGLFYLRLHARSRVASILIVGPAQTDNLTCY